jgi:hypothetical protein
MVIPLPHTKETSVFVVLHEAVRSGIVSIIDQIDVDTNR